MKTKRGATETPAKVRRQRETRDEISRELYRAVLELKTVEECRRFFVDLCTPAELEAIGDRWLVAQLVDSGLPYREINEQSGVSTATVTRINRALTDGEGGYRLMLSRRSKKGRGRKT